MTGLRDFTCRTHEVAFGEQFTGLHTELTTNHLLIEAVVTIDDYIVDTRLWAFEYTHFKVDGVTTHVFLNRHKVEEEVTFVHIIV